MALACFLACLEKIEPTGGPPPGPHNFFRGGPAGDLRRRDSQGDRRSAADDQRGPGDRGWETALAATWHGGPVWVHGDVSAGNLLVLDGRLAAVIDFGCSGVGDPACDLAIAWTFLSGQSREAFRVALPLDVETWARGRGWALWKALITFAGNLQVDQAAAATASRVIDEVLDEHVHTV